MPGLTRWSRRVCYAEPMIFSSGHLSERSERRRVPRRVLLIVGNKRAKRNGKHSCCEAVFDFHRCPVPVPEGKHGVGHRNQAAQPLLSWSTPPPAVAVFASC